MWNQGNYQFNMNQNNFMNNNQFHNNVNNGIQNGFNNMNNNMNPMINMNQMNKMNNMGIQMNMMNDSFNLMNNQMNQNNMMTMSNIPINNNIINNPMFQMCNLMNNNNSFQMMQTGNNINKEEIKNLVIIFRISKGQQAPLMVQCQSNEKMEEAVDKFCNKSGMRNIDGYYFIYNAKRVDFNATLEENGIVDNSNIFIVEKSQEQISKEKELNINQNINNNSSVLEEEWLLIFHNQNRIGSDITIKIGKTKLVREAINKFCQSLDISKSTQKYFKFIFNNNELFKDMQICQSGLNNGSKILVIDYSGLVGA